MKLKYATCCMVGGKRRNEDAIFARVYEESNKTLFVVCDGMSGLHIGDEASKAVVEVFESVWGQHHKAWGNEQLLKEAVTLGKKAIDGLSRYDVGTTIVLAAVEDDTMLIGHLGDSRSYYMRPGSGIVYQTEDHITIGQEGWPYVSKGFFNFREVDAPTVRTFKPQPGDRILLCSDGVYGCYRGNALVDLLSEKMQIDTMMSNIVGYCDEYATDNYSAILIEVEK